jgi:large subunit ribosomal protein L23
MKALHQIIRRPLVTEKSTAQKESGNQVTFEVHQNANKIEIRDAVEKLFKVKVLGVNTIALEGKRKRVGRSMGRRPNWKKAIVTLKQGDTIDFFEGV